MGMQKDKKTKKGPKGKKARRQAKLDNRWGETAAVDAETGDEIKKTTRRGHGTGKAMKGDVNRKLAQYSNETIEAFYMRLERGRQEQQEQEEQTTRSFSLKDKKRIVEYDDSSSSSESEDEDMDQDDHDNEDDQMGIQNNPMGGLLNMIRNQSTKSRDESDKDEDESYSDSDSSGSDDEDSESDDEEMMVDEHDNDQNNAINDSPNLNPGMDFFRRRFGRPPLNKSELSQLDGGEKATVKKLSVTKHVELQHTLPLVSDVQKDNNDTTMCSDLLGLETPEAWHANAKETFANGTREVLQRHWTRGGKMKSKSDYRFSDSQAPVYSFLARYADVFDATSATGKGSNNSKGDRQNQKDQHRLQTLHVLNHVLTSRTRIGRNNRYLKEKEASAEEENEENIKDQKQDSTEERDVRDQGFTRPSVLVLLPTRGTCHRFVKDLYKLSGAPIDEEQEDRFDADYGELIDEGEEEDDDDAIRGDPNKEAQKQARRKAVLDSKGKEWNEYFGDKANQDDDFKIGISLIPKTVNKNKANNSNVSIRLYSDFFKSDIIVASPLGLKMILSPEGDQDDDDSDDEENKNAKKGNNDYLSSIEICLLQHSEMILMQNWDHVNEILSLLNKDPLNNNGTDFSRVRNYLLDGQGARWRQLILSTKFWDPVLLSTFKRFGKSLSGQVKVRRKIRDGDASISRVLVPIKQVFQKVPAGTFAQQSKARVDYFVKKLWPQIQKNDQRHTLVFIPSYFDFCSVRNALLKLEKKHLFVSVTEYSRGTEIGRGRARFLQGRKPLMLYTGRAHYFHRHAIKGVHNLVVLGLPEHPEFYADFVNLIQTNDSMEDGDPGQHRETSCLALFTKYEAHALERIVGSSNASRMVSSPNSAFMFYS